MHSQTHSQTSIVEAGQDLRMSPAWLFKILKPDGMGEGAQSHPDPCGFRILDRPQVQTGGRGGERVSFREPVRRVPAGT